jgi:serine/threonine-protein kinase
MTDPSRTPLVPGSLVGGKYRLLRRLGTGAMGVVWAAVNETTLSEVAVKLLGAGQPEFRQRLLREARSCGQLKHRNIIDIYDVATTEDGDPFLVMQLLQGETLAQRLKRLRRLEPAEAALIARDIARALTVAHAKHIIHRDLKPANIFLQEDEAAGFVVKVLDFGVAKNLAASDGLHTVAGAAIGSLPYMSPEQAKADPNVDHRADLWSLGVVLFEMLAGRRPFQGGMSELILAVTRDPIPSLAQLVRGVDEGLVRVVDRCLERRLDLRVASAADLAKLLEPHAAPADRPAAAEARPPADAAPRPPRAGSSPEGWADPMARPSPAPEIRQPPPAAAGEDSTTVPRGAAVARGAPWPGEGARDQGDEVTRPLQPGMAAPARPASSPEIPQAAAPEQGLGGTVRISAAEAAQIAAANRNRGPLPVPPAPPPPARSPVTVPLDAMETIPLQRPPAHLRMPQEAFRPVPQQPRPAPPAQPPHAPEGALLAPDPPPRQSPILRVFLVSAVVSIVLSIVAYAILTHGRETPAPPVGAQQGG